MPSTSSALVTAGADLSYDFWDGFYVGAGADLVGTLSKGDPLPSAGGMINRLYLSAGWRMLHADVGIKPRRRDFGDLSLTGGNIIYSGYARELPGVNLWSDWIYFEKGHWFGVKGNLAQYKMMDERWTMGTLVHNKSLAFKLALGRKVDLEFGIDHWVQWGGVSRDLGQRPSSWKDYYRVMFALPGGNDATDSDRQNALGNHLGREFLRLRWRASDFVMTFQYDLPFEDGRTMIRIQNAPDGVYTLSLALNERKALVTDVIYEYVHTTWQSGDVHDRPATEEEMTTVYPEDVDNYWQDPDDFYYGRIVIGGRDNYFHNGEYRSGWTYYGKSLGLPLILAQEPGPEGVVKRIENNRIRGHHLGLKGLIGDLPYMFKATYSSNWGAFGNPSDSFFNTRPWQMSLAFELELGKQVTDLPMILRIGAYGDFGELYRNSAGLSFKIMYKGSSK